MKSATILVAFFSPSPQFPKIIARNRATTIVRAFSITISGYAETSIFRVWIVFFFFFISLKHCCRIFNIKTYIYLFIFVYIRKQFQILKYNFQWFLMLKVYILLIKLILIIYICLILIPLLWSLNFLFFANNTINFKNLYSIIDIFQILWDLTISKYKGIKIILS